MKIDLEGSGWPAIAFTASLLFMVNHYRQQADPYQVGRSTPAVVNQTNAETEADRLDQVTVSVSAGTMRWQQKTWKVFANQHTPRGRFKIADWQPGKNFGIASDFVLPFKSVLPQQMPDNNPNKAQAIANASYSVWAIHADNRISENAVAAGCILVTPDDLVDMTMKLQGATLVVAD